MPSYHDRKYNGEAMCTFIENSSKIMDDIAEVLQKNPKQDRCKNFEVLEVTSKFRFSLTVFDAFFFNGSSSIRICG